MVLSLSVEVLVLGKEGGTVTSLAISKPLGVLKLGAQRNLVLLESANGILSLLNLTTEVLGLNLKFLAVLLHVGTVAHGLLKSRPGLLKVPLHTSLVLLSDSLVLVDGINLVAQLSHAVVVLLAQSSKGALMGNVGLIKVNLQLGELRLALLVQLNLSAGVGSSLFQPGSKILQIPGEQRTVLLSLGTVGSLNGQLLVKLINTGHKLLDLLGVL